MGIVWIGQKIGKIGQETSYHSSENPPEEASNWGGGWIKAIE